MRDGSERLDVGDIAGRVADAFAVDGTRILIDQLFDVFRLSLSAKRQSIPCLRNTE